MQNLQYDRERFDEYLFEIRCRRCGNQDSYSLIKELLPLAKKLPGYLPDWRNEERLTHCFWFGYILTVRKRNKLVGYAELYQTSGMPKHPVIPCPVSNDEGKLLYVWACVAENAQMIRRMKEFAALNFDIEEIGYHRHRRGNRAHVERVKIYEHA